MANKLAVLKSSRMLYVEDHPGIREELADTFRLFVADVVEASAFDDALRAFQSDLFHCIVCDINLGDDGRDGLDLVEAIRAIDRTIPILVLTGHKDEALLMRSITLGLTGYLIKPIVLDELKQALIKCARQIEEHSPKKIPLGDGIYFDLAFSQIEHPDGMIRLGRKEFRLLRLLFEKQGKVVTRHEIESVVYDDEESFNDGALKSLMNKVRRKIGVPVIQTISSVGYSLRLETLPS